MISLACNGESDPMGWSWRSSSSASMKAKLRGCIGCETSDAPGEFDIQGHHWHKVFKQALIKILSCGVIKITKVVKKIQESPELKDIYDLGTVAQILRVLKMPDGNTTIIIQGKKRFQIDEIITEDPYFKAKIIKQNN